jgi:hypothetical protein
MSIYGHLQIRAKARMIRIAENDRCFLNFSSACKSAPSLGEAWGDNFPNDFGALNPPTRNP